MFDADTAQWEQAFSFDGGTTWVRNWRMTFIRTSDGAGAGAGTAGAQAVGAQAAEV